MTPALVLVLVGTVSAGHTFTNNKGQSFEGEIQRVSPDGTKVSIERTSDSARFEVPVTMFTEADQEFIAEWAKTHINYRFDMDHARKTVDKRKEKTSNSTVTTKVTAIEVVLSNRSFADLEDLVVKYRIYKRGDDKGSGETKSKVSGERSIKRLPHNGKLEFTTDTIDLVEEEMDARWRRVTSDGKSESKMRERVTGFWLKVFHNGIEVADFRELDGSLKNEQWRE